MHLQWNISETRDYWITYNVGALFDENSQWNIKIVRLSGLDFGFFKKKSKISSLVCKFSAV